MFKRISDYGIIGNLRTIALVGLDGGIDWLCFPFIDSPSVFGALLDDKEGGSFALRPAGPWASVSEYLPGTNILKTRFTTEGGVMELTDFMPLAATCKGDRESGDHELYRRVSVISGAVGVNMVFRPHFNYARSQTTVIRNGRMLVARGGEEVMTLSVSADISGENGHSAQWELKEGESLWFRLRYDSDEGFVCDSSSAETAFAETEEYWRTWLGRRETGRSLHLGRYQHMVDRSALVLKLLQFEETGTIAAAATTSLPEEVGGVRNWDYRYTWVRDTSFTLDALFSLGHLSELDGYLRWMERLLVARGAENMKIVYGLRGEEELQEQELGHLDGYRGSRPVRVGNEAASQRQLDVYGEIMDAALKLSNYAGKIDHAMWPALRDVCNHVVHHWQDRDSGIWEVRGGPYSFVYSKVMCWVALDRGLEIAKRYGFQADRLLWEETRSRVKDEVLAKGWSREKKSFVQHYETDALDASSLLLPIFGFLSFDDPRVASTVDAIERELGKDGFLYRYTGEDGLPGKEAAFTLCSFWLVDCLIGMGRVGEAETLLRRLEGTANHLGLFSEEYDEKEQEALGNFPQALTHIGYINSVINLLDARGELVKETTDGRRPSLLKRLISSETILNGGVAAERIPPGEIAARLKNTMNILRGAFFDVRKGRVAYEKMKGSEAYRTYLDLSYSLRDLDPHLLRGRREGMAFWINLYNVIVIHGVVELGVRDSVKEVRDFFRKVCYLIGGVSFTPHDIEHGILRGNRRPPYVLSSVFGRGDPRLAFVVDPPDPRVHFALVCASSSCPPIDVYTADNLDEELDISGRTFLNAGSVSIDRKNLRVSLSRIFKWYEADFGKTQEERLRFVASYLYDENDQLFLEERAEELAVTYQKYDWRLNRQ
ncbi:MAG: glycoside hydrolase family 15 protein [Candidatus Sulfobium sp.]